MESGDPRQIAFTILRRVDRQGAYSSVLLQNLDRSRIESRDLALINELVYGVLRRLMYLDHVIAAFSSRPLERIDPDLRLTLRLALYQILFLTRVPPHAAVNEAVEMARRAAPGDRHGADAAASFVNGLLRALLRDRARVPAPPQPSGSADPVAALAIAESHPEWLVRRWVDRLGADEAALLLAAQNRQAHLALRVTLRAESREAVAAALAAVAIPTHPSRFLDDFLIAEGGSPQHEACFSRGELYIQDEASGLVARLAGGRPGDRVLDACAAPGGKTLYISEKIGPDGLVIAGDLHPARLGLLLENARRLGLVSCLAVAADFAGQDPPLRAGTSFDTVVLDAPCSGTGVIRRNPELRYRVSAGALRQLASVQSSLLSRCARLVRPGGALVYSVCSLEPEEGIERIERFVREQPDFTLADPRPFLPVQAGCLVTGTATGAVLTTLPHRDDLDGFFAARLQRQR